MPTPNRVDYRYCPVCGHRLTRRQTGGKPRLVCPDCSFVFYQNAKPAALGLIIRGHSILLVKRAVNPRKGYWDLPGGFVEESEHPDAGLRRELREELGVSSRIIRLLGMSVGKYTNPVGPASVALSIYYHARISGKVRPADDICEARWFPLSRLPRDLAFRHIRVAVRRWRSILK